MNVLVYGLTDVLYGYTVHSCLLTADIVKILTSVTHLTNRIFIAVDVQNVLFLWLVLVSSSQLDTLLSLNNFIHLLAIRYARHFAPKKTEVVMQLKIFFFLASGGYANL